MIRTGNKKISLDKYMDSLSITGAGKVTWRQIVEAGYDTVEHINEMSVQEIANVGGSDSKKIGEKTAQKIWDCLHSDRVQELLKFSNLWVEKDLPIEDIAAAMDGIENTGMRPDKIAFVVPNDTNLQDIAVAMQDKVEMSDSLRIEIEEDESELKMDLQGKKVLFTGKYEYSRQTLTSVLKRNGAILQDNIRKDTEILICADLNSNSNKAKKARKWGIKMVTYGDVFRE